MYGDAPRRMLWTREQGTRRLLLVLVTVGLIWFISAKLLDQVLLSKHWAPLRPTLDGLTVVGTLNARGQYDRNLFKIVTANKTSRVELTDYGWNSIFDPRNGPMCDARAASAIEKARSIDSMVGFAMLEPYLRASIARELGDKAAFEKIRADLPVYLNNDPDGKSSRSQETTLGAILKRYTADSGSTDSAAESDNSEGGSGSGREAEHGITLPADTVASVCPVVLTGPMFSDAWLEEQPPNMFTHKAFTLHLGLTREGRSRFFQWSHAHANEGYVFVLGHQVVLAGGVPETLDVSELDIRNVEDEQAAKQVVEWITNRKASDG